MDIKKEISDAIQKHEHGARRIFVLSPDSSKIQKAISFIIEGYLKYTEDSMEWIGIVSLTPEKYYHFKKYKSVLDMENEEKLMGDPDYYLERIKNISRMDALLNIVDQVPLRPHDIETLTQFVFVGRVIVIGLITNEKTVPAQFAFPKEIESFVKIPDQILLP